MTFEYITEKDNKIKKLSQTDEAEIVSIICENYDRWNILRRDNLDKADALQKEIFFKTELQKKKNLTKEEQWKTKVNMCKTYMFFQVLRAFIWKNVYSNVNSMFDVSGENQEADNDSNKQKAYLVDRFEKMKYQQTCEKVIDNALIYGQLITFVGWKKKTEEYRKKIGLEDMTNLKALTALSKGKFHYIAEKLVYDNPFITPVNPANFVFDPSQKDNWDDCPKIYREFKNPDDIINNEYYKVSKEVEEELRSLVNNSEVQSQLSSALENETVNGGTIETLQHWGNFRLKDGTLLKNWHIVIVNRKHVVRFEKNVRVVNPFNYQNLIEDPESYTGISPLFCILSMAKMQEDLMNRTCDMQALQENPPIYAPKGFFKEEEVTLYPGRIIEFGDSLSPSEIKQMEFSVSVFLNDITFLSDIMSEVSGIFPNMAGADEEGNKTATEISTKAQGQLTRLAMIIDTINQLITEDVKKVAKLCAFFKSGNEQIFINSGNQKEVINIDDRIRQQEYRYTYSDRTATTERSNKADLVVQAIERFAKYVPLNVPEIFTWYMEQKDVENPERFLQQQNIIPVEVQQQLMQDPRMRSVVQQFMRLKAQQQEQNGQDKQQAVIPDASIEQAQPME